MAERQFTLAAPPGYQCYDCESCGDCCRGLFDIALTREEFERIQAQHWEDDPALNGVRWYERRGRRYFLAHHPDGACVFLDERNLCRIHAKFGEPTKPLACRLYPFVFVPVEREARVDIRFDCPAVAGSRGRAVTEYRPYLKELLPQVVPAAALDLPAPPFFPGAWLEWPQLREITSAFERLLLNRKLDVTRRLLGAVNLAAVLRTPRLSELQGRKFDEFLEKVGTKVMEAARDDSLPRVKPSGGVGMMFRQLLGVYGRADRIGERVGALQRLKVSLRMVQGKGLTPALRPGFPEVDFAALEEPLGIPDSDVLEPLLRVYRVRLASLGFFGRAFYHRGYLDGLNALLLTYPLTLWFARVFAVADGRREYTRADIERAVQHVDHQHGHSPLLDVPGERFRQRFLAERSHLRSLVVWYGS